MSIKRQDGPEWRKSKVLIRTGNSWKVNFIEAGESLHGGRGRGIACVAVSERLGRQATRRSTDRPWAEGIGGCPEGGPPDPDLSRSLSRSGHMHQAGQRKLHHELPWDRPAGERDMDHQQWLDVLRGSQRLQL